MKIKNLGGPFRAKIAASAMFLFCLLAAQSAAALTTVSQGYSTTSHVAVGSIVSVVDNSSDEVESTTTKNTSNIIGVVIDDGNSLLALTSSKATQIQVATSGVTQVLVSDINGTVHQGDEITASPISGVGMKATINTKVVGIAQADLTTNNSSPETYQDKAGTHTVRIGEIPVLINVSYFYKQPDKTIIPSAIQNVANSVAGKSVDSLPILISMAIFVITLIIVASIVYSMIRSSIISVGRNPMSQSAIYRDLTQMSALVVGILGVSVVAIYMVLTRL